MVSVYGAMTHERKARIWQLWRQGRPMSEIARVIEKPPATVYSYLLYHAGSHHSLGFVAQAACHSRSVRRYLEVWRALKVFAALLGNWDGRRRQFPGKSRVMAVAMNTVLAMQKRRFLSAANAPRQCCWPRMLSYDALSPKCWSWTGHQNKYQGG